MIDDGIIYRCNSINNTLVRKGELKILRKFADDLYFEFGASEMNIKKRFYKDKETLNKDYNAVLELKEKEKEKEEKSSIDDKKNVNKKDDMKAIDN